jgi:hypothetical protein
MPFIIGTFSGESDEGLKFTGWTFMMFN